MAEEPMSKEPKTDLVVPAPADDPVLPGETTVDSTRLDAAVAELNRIHTAKGLEAVRDMGRYLLDTFFGGDYDAFQSRGRKHLSFRKLEEREDLHVSASTLWNAVAIVRQLELLPRDIAQALPVSHHRLLLPIRSTERKLELARVAANGHLTRRQLAEKARAVRKAETAGKRAGRPALPGFYKALRAVQRSTAQATVHAVRKFEFSEDGTGLRPEQLAKLLDQLEAQMKDLQAVIDAGRAKVTGDLAPF